MFAQRVIKAIAILLIAMVVLHAKEAVVIGVKSSDVASVSEKYAPLKKLLEEKSGLKISVKGYATLEELSAAVKSGAASFVLASPTDYLKLHESAKAEVVATKLNKGGTPYCQGTIVAAKNKGIETVADLKGKKICYGPKGSFNKYLAALAAFKEAGLKESDMTSEFGSGCGNIADHIVNGKTDAGVICDYSWDGWNAKDKNPYAEKLQVVGKGPKLRDLAVAASPKTDKAVVTKIVAALLELKDAPEILAAPLKAKGFAKSSDADYNALREIVKTL